MDHQINLPDHFQYVNQFAPSVYAEHPSTMRCGPASTAMAAEIAYPGRWNPTQLEDALYREWAGPDVATDENGTQLSQITAWLAQQHVGFINMQSLVDEFNNGNKDPLRLELGAMNAQGVPQIITVFDEAYLFQAVPNPHYDAADPGSAPYIRGSRLHNWVDASDPKHTVYHHVILRIGFSDSEGYGLYAEPAAPGFCVNSKGQFEPVKILWSDVEAAGVTSCLAIMPSGVPTPPSGFDYRSGTWPEPEKPALDAASLKADVEAFKAQLDQERQASDATFLKILAELAQA